MTIRFCKDPKCSKYGIIINNSQKFLWYHYFCKPRERLIELVLLNGLLEKPYHEKKEILANVLTDFSEVKQ